MGDEGLRATGHPREVASAELVAGVQGPRDREAGRVGERLGAGDRGRGGRPLDLAADALSERQVQAQQIASVGHDDDSIAVETSFVALAKDRDLRGTLEGGAQAKASKKSAKAKPRKAKTRKAKAKKLGKARKAALGAYLGDRIVR